jgi:hypothetical protein
VQLPALGHQLEQAFLAFVAFDASADSVILDAVREGLDKVRQRKAMAGILGLSVCNPLLARLKRAVPASVYRTRIETVTLPGQPSPQLDGRVPQPEVAIL